MGTGAVTPLDESAAGAIRETVIALHATLRRFAAVVAPVELDPDDLTQEAWLRVLRQGHNRINEYDNVAAYMRRTIVNLAANERRRLGRGRRALTRLGDPGQGHAMDQSYPSDLAELQRLEPADRAALYLIEIEGWSHREVAAVLGCSEGASRVRFARARKRLRLELEGESA
jgi:RNA polymerase sigma-70 factor (ECF subfamily)